MRSKLAAVAAAAVAAAALAAGVLAAGRPVFGPWGATLSYMDTRVAPGNDFFRYTNGTWLRSATIPPDRRLAGVNLELDQSNEAKLRAVVEAVRAKPESALTAEERKLRDFYGAFVDTRAIDAAGLAPVRADLDRIAALQTAADVAAFMGNATSGTYGPFSVYITIDQNNPASYTVRLM